MEKKLIYISHIKNFKLFRSLFLCQRYKKTKKNSNNRKKKQRQRVTNNAITLLGRVTKFRVTIIIVRWYLFLFPQFGIRFIDLGSSFLTAFPYSIWLLYNVHCNVHICENTKCKSLYNTITVRLNDQKYKNVVINLNIL